MTLIGSATRGQAVNKLDALIPSNLYLRNKCLPARSTLHDDFLMQSDGDWWFNPDSVDKYLRFDGLTEEQLNVQLTTGHIACPACKNDLARKVPTLPGQAPIYGFYDYDTDNVRIQHQFACRKCRHQWGPVARGQRDDGVASVVAVSGARPSGGAAITEPKPGTAGAAAFAVADSLYASPTRPADWKTFRLSVIARAQAEGQNPGNVGTELPRWRKLRGYYGDS